jgi:hypothetical protein
VSAVGGSIQAVSIGGTDFSVAADADVMLDLGGTKPTVHRNGDGSSRVTGEEVPWSLSGIEVAIDASRNQLVFLQSVAHSMEFVNCTITLVDGTTYQGLGMVVDDRAYSTAKATMPLALMGSGELTSQ